MEQNLPVSDDLRRLLARAAQINRAAGDQVDLAFSAVLIAFLIATDPVSDWFKRYTLEAASGVDVESLLASRKLDQNSLVDLANRPPDDAFLNTDRLSTSASTDGILKNALGLQSNIQNSLAEPSSSQQPLDVRFVMGAFIFMPAGHERDLDRWKFNRPHWSNAFIEWISRMFEQELAGWVAEHRHAFNRDPEILSSFVIRRDSSSQADQAPAEDGVGQAPEGSMPEGETGRQEPEKQPEMPPGSAAGTGEEDQAPSGGGGDEGKPPSAPPPSPPEPPVPEGEGPSPHIATDRWTVDDALGYRSYAYAIYRFLTHRQTSPPLTVSIQAPWGGGKTSLMRMVQAYLDPESPDQVTKSTPEEAAPKPAGLRAAGSAAAEESTSPLPTGELTLDHLLKEIDAWIATRTKQPLPRVSLSADQPQRPRRLSVWFNAWKYESTNQVWAGLADAILQQVAARLDAAQREIFWFRLNLKRIDTDKLRVQVYQRIFNTFWQKSLPWIWGSGVALLAFLLAALGGWMAQASALRNLGAMGFIFSALGSGLVLFSRYLETEQAAKKEPASVSLGEYLTVPDYRAQLGFIHQVDKDLHDVFACIPEERLPIVIFIDDLDRCSPEKVAEVVEGVNLFLAGDFPACMFVLGMDPEMVAAALEAAHEKMIARLPKDASTPVGWRFMDKFVQLPFVIPPPTPKDLEGYTEALFTISRKANLEPKMRSLLQQLTRISGDEAFPKAAEEMIQNAGLASDDIELALQEAQNLAMIKEQEKRLDVGIETFNDQDEQIRAQIREAAKSFSHNPRELKRFVNAMRFNYYLLWTCIVRGYGQEISLEQLQRWVVLSMKWPEVVRWIRRSGGREAHSGSSTQAGNGRLRKLEEMGKKSSDITLWQQHAQADLDLDPKEARWLHDEDLLAFFQREGKLKAGKRLSDAAGKGLW